MLLIIEVATKFIFQLLQTAIDFVQSVVFGSSKKHIEGTVPYETSAHVAKVIWKFKKSDEYEFSREKDFLSIFEKAVHPSIILDDNISLYTISQDEAVFVDCGNVDIFDKKYAFVYDGQYRNAVKVITMPLSSFHLVSKHISLPKIPIVHLANHGRCGSTLLTKVFESIPGSLSISELNGFTDVAEMSRNLGTAKENSLKQICGSVLMCTLKHATSRNSSTVLIKCQNTALFIADLMQDVLPSLKQVYMYRQPVPFVQSYEKLQAANLWNPLSAELCSFWGGIGSHKILSAYPNIDEKISSLSNFAKWALVWITSYAAYQSLLTKGYEIKSLKYEHLLQKPNETLSALFEYLGIPVSQMPDIQKSLSKDSQLNTPFSTRSMDKEVLKKCLTPITEELRREVNDICNDFKVPCFWDDLVLDNRI